jgi:hypothetical protein
MRISTIDPAFFIQGKSPLINYCCVNISRIDSNLWNSTVGVYDPYAERYIETLEFEGITRNPEFHFGGIVVNQRTGVLSIVVDAGAAFNTAGQDISGTNWIMQFDPKTREVLYQFNLTSLSKGRYGGPQDVELDPEGNTYTVWTFSSAITKTDKRGRTTEWYVRQPFNHTQWGYSGLAAKYWMLLVPDEESGTLFRFDLRKDEGVPKRIPVSPDFRLVLPDAAHLPRKYNDTVLLVAQLFNGTAVFESKSGKWDKAEYKGTVSTPTAGWVNTAVLQVGSSIYMVTTPPFTEDPIVPGQLAGNRTDFPFQDITREVDALLGHEGFTL